MSVFFLPDNSKSIFYFYEDEDKPNEIKKFIFPKYCCIKPTHSSGKIIFLKKKLLKLVLKKNYLISEYKIKILTF